MCWILQGRLPPVVLEQDREDAPGAAECESAPAEPEASDSSLKTPCTSVDVSKKEEAGDMFECPVTACVVPLTETFALKCSHRYSNA